MSLLLRFTVHLENYDIDELVRPKGPLFHRWLPDGELDALVLQTGDSRKQIKLWFERSGFVDGGFIKYDRVRQEVDAEIMKRQGHLDAGQLWGECRFGYVTSGELNAIRENRTASKEYIATGKRVVAFIHSMTSYFVDILRFQYGQHWLSELPAWDSRTQSLGAYCASTLWLQWREVENRPWQKFRPDALSHTVPIRRLPGRAFGEYLTEADWRHIQNTFSPKGPMPLALRLAGRAHQLRETGHQREAFVEAVTAVELAVAYILARSLAPLSKDAKASAIIQFANTTLASKLSLVAAIKGQPSPSVLDSALEGINLRNMIVHEGAAPKDADTKKLMALLECVRDLLNLGELKNPVLFAGNQLAPVTHGEREGLTASIDISSS